MKKDKLYIDMPDEITIQNEINSILEKGIKKEEPFYLYMKNMYGKIGVKYLFHDAGEIIFTVTLILTLLILAAANITSEINVKSESLYVFIMIVSPILYLVMSLLAFVIAKDRGTYEIMMTCKYNLYELAAFRMFVFSIICILSNVVLICTITARYDEINFWRAFVISVTSLFLFSTTFLYIMFITGRKFVKYIVIIGWIFINFALSIFNKNIYIELLTSMPIFVYLIVTAFCIYTYLKKLKKLINFSNMKGVI